LKRKANIQRRYRLENVEDGIAKISVRTIGLTILDDFPQQQAQLMRRLWTGQLTFDIDRGIMIRKELNLDQEVVGFSGQQSRLHVKMHRIETFVENSGTQNAAIDPPAIR
jgi:hypothetical protein